MDLKGLPLNNIRRNIGRSAGLAVLVALLAFAVYGGTLVVSSLRGGLASLESRLGADLIVVPDQARSTTDLEAMLVEGVPGNFYMDRSYVERIAALDGVEVASPQYFLATVKAGCCSMPVQIIGIDAATDFTIQPWIARSYSSELGFRDVVAGCNITGAPGTTIRFYGHDCTIVAKLDETGTALDNAVFASPETVADLIEGSAEQGISVLADYSPDQVVSTIQVKVADGYSVEAVVDEINLHVRGVSAVRSKAMTSGVSDSIAGTSRVIGILVVVIWVLGIGVLAVVFSVLGRQRAREFAVLRVIGASRSDLSGILVRESAAISAAGALAGIVVAAVAMIGFSGAIEASLGLPFLMPGAPELVGFGVLAFAVTLAVGMCASLLSARRLSAVDPGQTLRGE